MRLPRRLEKLPNGPTFSISSQAVQHNGSVYLHMLFAPATAPIFPDEPDYDESRVFGQVFSELSGDSWLQAGVMMLLLFCFNPILIALSIALQI